MIDEITMFLLSKVPKVAKNGQKKIFVSIIAKIQERRIANNATKVSPLSEI